MTTLKLTGLNGEKIVYDEKVLEGLSRSILSLYNKIDFSKVSFIDNIILDAYASATIEGAVTTIDKVRSGLKVKSYDKNVLMATNCVKVIHGASKFRLTEQWLINQWNNVVQGVCENLSCRGNKYRSGMVYVGKHTPARVCDIQSCMDSLFNYIREAKSNPFIVASVCHFYFVYVHPFCDGNGRMARILSSKVLYDRGFKCMFRIPISNTILNSVNYYHKYIFDSGLVINGAINITPFLSYMLSVYESALKSLLFGSFSELEVTLYNLIGEHIGAEISVQKASKITHESESKVRDTLNKMVFKGYLAKRKEGSRYLYRINLLRN